MQVGEVKWFDEKKGFGFIGCQGKDYFVHFKEIHMPGYKTLLQGDKVEFDAGRNPKGLYASNVRPVEKN